jgi:DNA-binding transcriptional LysR family regulator
MDLNPVAWFVRVVETESFTRAALELGVPKSSVSRAVTRLESELGVRLLERTTRRLNLTDAGRAYYDRARIALADLEEAQALASDMGKAPRGTVRLTAPVDAGVALIPEIVAEFVRQHPHIHVELSFSSRVVDLVKEGFDVAIRAGKLQDSSLVARKVGAADLGIFGSPQYLARRGTPQSFAELARHDWVLFRARDGKARVSLSSAEGERSIDVTGPVSADELLVVHHAVEAGLGLGLLPAFMVTEYSSPAGSRLSRVLPEYALRGAGIYVVTPSLRHQPARVSLFRDFLIEALTRRIGGSAPSLRRAAARDGAVRQRPLRSPPVVT